MQITRQQRIDLFSIGMIQELAKGAELYREVLKSGKSIPAQEGVPALKFTGDEIKKSIGENLSHLEEILALILDQKKVDAVPEPGI